MALEIVENLSRLWEIEPEWTPLVQRSHNSTPFQLPLWLLTWWEHFGSGNLHVLVFRSNLQLVGVVPFFSHNWENRRQLTLIGSGISDYLDPVIVQEFTGELIAELQRHLDGFGGWDIGVWQDLSSNSPFQQLRGAKRIDEVPCSEARLTGNFESFWEARSKDLRRNFRRYSQRAAEMGPVTFEVCCEASPKLLNDLIRLHAARWHEQGEPGMIAANRSAEFLRNIASEMSGAGLLRFFVLRFKGDVVALILGFLYRNRVYGYMSAFDPDYETLGFGRTLLYEAFRYAYGLGFEAWNFLRGDEPYKSSWGAQPIPRCRIVIERE